MRSTLLTLASLALLAGCSQNPAPVSGEGNVGAACTKAADCETPTNYLIRSSCPFTSVCDAGKCAVACPMASKDPEASASDVWKAKCEQDTDCDCGGYTSGTSDSYTCGCNEGLCYAVVR